MDIPGERIGEILSGLLVLTERHPEDPPTLDAVLKLKGMCEDLLLSYKMALLQLNREYMPEEVDKVRKIINGWLLKADDQKIVLIPNSERIGR